jgi:hypothetical protein
MQNDEHDDLWELLGKRREPKDSPFFASKVIRAVQAAEEPQAGLLAWLRQRWILPLAAGVTAVLVAILVFHRPANEAETVAVTTDPLEEMAQVASITAEIESLEALLASEDHSIWLAAEPLSPF